MPRSSPLAIGDTREGGRPVPLKARGKPGLRTTYQSMPSAEPQAPESRKPATEAGFHSDKELAAAILRKDRKATAEWVSLYADSVYTYVRRRLVPRADRVDDVVQEVFLAAWESLGQFEGKGNSSLGSWLLGIARHKVEDYYRRCLRQADMPLEEDYST